MLVIGDYFTKWTEAFPMRDMESITVAKILVQDFTCRYGTPEQIHTDQGHNFEATLIKEIYSLLGIQKTRTTPYYPKVLYCFVSLSETVRLRRKHVVPVRIMSDSNERVGEVQNEGLDNPPDDSLSQSPVLR